MKIIVVVILVLLALARAQDQNCEYPQDAVSGSCTSCKKGFYIVNGVCTSLPENANCESYDMHSGNCNNCWWGDVVDGGICVSASQVSTDTSCPSGTYLSDDVCVDGSTTCATFDNSGTNSCASCWSDNQYIDAETHLCVYASSLCASIDSKGNCLSCFQGNPVNGVCPSTQSP